ncbi:hypothetical protein FH972_001631 [Carpinus fangiana]|uniref:Uncharacterized protein n=1 Tax=Carpinus fangiana TaxID=176857 RepID=A0A5N6QCP5_9ROSI|nr:hypothetical protein FH972_001631 [Carpinus fangiana]
MVAIGQTITVVNKSGKVVSNSKHIVNVFKEARSAYREKKAELKASREEEAERRSGVSHKKKRHTDDAASVASSRSSRSHMSSRRSSYEAQERRHNEHYKRGSAHRSSRRSKPAMARGYSDSFNDQDGGHQSDRIRRSPTSPLQYSRNQEDQAEIQELARRHSDNDILAIRRKPIPHQDGAVDMDLAYGELPPPLPVRHGDEEQELRLKMTTLQKMLEEANCLQHSATAMIKNLESNPDAMAAVALTLAEISNLASKMAPGALMAMKGAFPAVVALLISPEFLIAAGVGVGITVVALGGYKIIKRIQNKKKGKDDKDGSGETEDDGNDLETIDGDLDRIESWRRGIEPVEAEGLGSSVDGEYVTPAAAKQLRADGVLDSKKEMKKRKEEKAAKANEDKKTKDKAKKEEKRRKANDKTSKAAGDANSGEKNAFQKFFASKKEKEVVGDYI